MGTAANNTEAYCRGISFSTRNLVHMLNDLVARTLECFQLRNTTSHTLLAGVVVEPTRNHEDVRRNVPRISWKAAMTTGPQQPNQVACELVFRRLVSPTPLPIANPNSPLGPTPLNKSRSGVEERGRGGAGYGWVSGSIVGCCVRFSFLALCYNRRNHLSYVL